MRYCGCSVKNQVLEIAWLSLNRLSSSIFCCLSVSLLGTRNTQLNLHLFKYIQAYKPYFDPEEYLQVPTVITFWSIHWIFLWPIWWVTPSILRLVLVVIVLGHKIHIFIPKFGQNSIFFLNVPIGGVHRSRNYSLKKTVFTAFLREDAKEITFWMNLAFPWLPFRKNVQL